MQILSCCRSVADTMALSSNCQRTTKLVGRVSGRSAFGSHLNRNNQNHHGSRREHLESLASSIAAIMDHCESLAHLEWSKGVSNQSASTVKAFTKVDDECVSATHNRTSTVDDHES